MYWDTDRELGQAIEQSMATKPPHADKYRAGNLEAAGAILENIAKYGGEDAMLVRWARLFMEDLTAQGKRNRAEPKDEGVVEILGDQAC